MKTDVVKKSIFIVSFRVASGLASVSWHVIYSRSHPKMSKAGSDRQLQMETQSFYQSAGEQSHV